MTGEIKILRQSTDENNLTPRVPKLRASNFYCLMRCAHSNPQLFSVQHSLNLNYATLSHEKRERCVAGPLLPVGNNPCPQPAGGHVGYGTTKRSPLSTFLV